jgi:hypothetical protein
MPAGVEWEDRPDPRSRDAERPLLVAAFAGWNDAADAATAAAEWLIHSGDSRRVAAIPAEDYVDYQSRRPHVELVGGVTRSITWPSNELRAVRVAGHDVFVLLGVEPNLRWKSFAAAVVDIARTVDCSLFVTLGALLGDTPHTRPVQVTGTATDAGLIERLSLARSRYEGPTGIVGVVNDACTTAGVPSASLWAPVPHYAAAPPNPPATRALLGRLALLGGLPLDLHDLDRLVESWRRQVDATVAGNDELERYVRDLELRVDGEDAATRGIVLGDHPSTGSLPDAEGLADEIEQFLREQGDGPR